MVEDVIKEVRRKMNHTIEVFEQDLSSVRTGRAATGLLNPVHVDYYGTMTPLHQLATISAPDAQLLTVTPYDKSVVKDVEKAIAASDLGLNPQVDGGTIRLPIPMLTEERRRELVKHVKKMGEDSKIALRNLRRDANDQVKKLEKDKQISQDDERNAEQTIQKETDAHVKQIDELVASKEQDLMTV